jgi:hypothetical protein
MLTITTIAELMKRLFWFWGFEGKICSLIGYLMLPYLALAINVDEEIHCNRSSPIESRVFRCLSFYETASHWWFIGTFETFFKHFKTPSPFLVLPCHFSHTGFNLNYKLQPAPNIFIPVLRLLTLFL